ncbi:hypothetical protein PYW08_004053 [Mythimna loreyi]|uniref:Uncharacterized protein n=1 Tax=Mythimna loreyi TaxID=667449 RepID=A0ACC2QX10_9NEOP|nr:hypothetical protein PYW08_004053 [Mythimna loreyi]
MIREQSLSTCPLSLSRDTPQTGVLEISKSTGILNMACAVLPPKSSVAVIPDDVTAIAISPCLLTSASMPCFSCSTKSNPRKTFYPGFAQHFQGRCYIFVFARKRTKRQGHFV